LALSEVMLIVPDRHGDARGYFSETFNAARFAEIGIGDAFVQDNESLSRDHGTLRGLHCQVPPYAQGKLVRVLRGAAFDVAVDARVGSPSHGKWVAARLTAEEGEQLWIPPGFLHGYLTLVDETEIFYKVTAPYRPEAERGIAWNDPDIAIGWPLMGAPILSAKDRVLPAFAEARDWFPG
ncbi:MAG: dTDP-4-dehydrorhamnose 3,5-epimerase, partial [Stellaceae bacterium]